VIEQPLNLKQSLSRFFLWHERRKEKSSQKRNAEDVSTSAEVDRRFAAGTRKTFKKVLSKLSHLVCASISAFLKLHVLWSFLLFLRILVLIFVF